MPVKSASYKFGFPKLWYKNLFRKNASLEAKTLTLGQVCEHYSEMLLKALSNALSRSIAALLVPDLCDDLWKVNKIRNKISWKVYIWWPVVTSAMTWSKNDEGNSERYCSELSVAFYLVFLACLLSEITWCGQEAPPPPHHGENGWEDHPGAC